MSVERSTNQKAPFLTVFVRDRTGTGGSPFVRARLAAIEAQLGVHLSADARAALFAVAEEVAFNASGVRFPMSS